MAYRESRIPKQSQEVFGQQLHFIQPLLTVKKKQINIGKWSQLSAPVTTDSQKRTARLGGAGCDRQTRSSKGEFHDEVQNEGPRRSCLSSRSAKFVADLQPAILKLEECPKRLRHVARGRIGRPSFETAGSMRQDSIAIG